MKRRCCETLVLIVFVLGLSSFMAQEQGSVYHVAAVIFLEPPCLSVLHVTISPGL